MRIGDARRGWVAGLACGVACGVASGVAGAHPPGADGRHGEEPTAPAAGDRADVGTLEFEILDATGRPIPGRLTFVTKDEQTPDLFPNAMAAPGDFAIRKNVIYTRSGHGAVTVPAGTYTVYASRGLEWSIASREIVIEEGKRSLWTPGLVHEVDTRGWVSGDFHLHTLTFSGHGDSNLNERIISLVGEGVEFAVATDHNHNTDYQPTIDVLEVNGQLRAVTGNEVSTSIGHFNAFPLEPDRPIPNHRIGDANELFQLIREEPNRYGITPIIQLNHPRWGGIDYFGQTGLDPATGFATSPEFSTNFDSLEIFNENEGWGYYRPGLDGVPTADSTHSVLEDWFNLLNIGIIAAAVGNSDSHTVHYDFAGYPRNFIKSATDEPAAIDPVAVAEAIRELEVFTTTGPFVEFGINETAMGGIAKATPGGGTTLHIRVQAASWVDVDRVKIVVNGDVVKVLEVPQERTVVRLDVREYLVLGADSWVMLQVEGDDSLAPVVCDQGRPIRPLAVTNPVWVDVDGNGEITPNWDQALQAVGISRDAGEFGARFFAQMPPMKRALLVLAVVGRRPAWAAEAVKMGLGDETRRVRLASARGAEEMRDGSLREALLALWARSDLDTYLRLTVLRALATCGETDMTGRLFELMERIDGGAWGRYGGELDRVVGDGFVREWQVLGYFADGEDPGAERGEGPWTGRDGGLVAWQPQITDGRGYLDFQAIRRDPALFEGAVAYARCWVRVGEERDVPLVWGADDEAALFVNGERVEGGLAGGTVGAAQRLDRARLRAGWNEITLRVTNDKGAFGAWMRVVGAEVSGVAP